MADRKHGFESRWGHQYLNHPESPIDVALEWHRVEIKRNRFSPRPVLRVIWLSEHREPGRTKYEIDHRQNVLRIRREFKLLRELQ